MDDEDDGGAPAESHLGPLHLRRPVTLGVGGRVVVQSVTPLSDPLTPYEPTPVTRPRPRPDGTRNRTSHMSKTDTHRPSYTYRHCAHPSMSGTNRLGSYL